MYPAFCFLLHSAPYQSALRYAQRKAEQTINRFPISKGEWNGGTGSLQRELQASLTSVPERPWLDSTNLAVTTGYHSLSRLSSLFGKKISKFSAAAFMSIFHSKKSPSVCKFHRFPLAFCRNHCYYIVGPHLRAEFLSAAACQRRTGCHPNTCVPCTACPTRGCIRQLFL